MRKTRKLLVLLAAIFGTLFAVASPGLASGLHWYHSQTPNVTVTYTSATSATVEATGQVAGAGTFINAHLTIDYTFPVSCFNPGNDTGPVPGQSQSNTFVSPQQTIQAIHGNASFDLGPYTISTSAPSSACPGSSWTAVAGPLTITNVTVFVSSSNGGSLTYADNGPFANPNA